MNSTNIIEGYSLTSAIVWAETSFAYTHAPPNVTASADKLGVWEMPQEIFVISMAVLCSEILLSIVTNITLILTILHSPNLKTPPNAHLINICATNLVLVVCMVFSVISLIHSGYGVDLALTQFCGAFQTFLGLTAFLQYWGIFCAIGHYRSRTIKKSSVSLKSRRKLIVKTITAGWVVSVLIGISVTLTFRASVSVATWNAFRRLIPAHQAALLSPVTVGQWVAVSVVIVVVFFSSTMIARSYYWILRTLRLITPMWSNQVTPWNRAGSPTSEETEVYSSGLRSYRPAAPIQQRHGGWVNPDSPFVITNGLVRPDPAPDNFIVHYQKRTQSLSIDDIFALEFPMKAQALVPHPRLQHSLSNTSTCSGRLQGGATAEFTDISPGAELQRIQGIKNKCALRNQSWRRDRVSLSSATKNSLVMLSTFLMTSLPFFLFSIPGVMVSTDTGQLNSALLFSALLFYANAPAYPVWYLIFSKRVRKCLQRLYDSALIRMRVRQ